MSGREAVADLHGNRLTVSTVLIPDAIPGDWVLLHAGFAIQRLSEAELQASWDVLDDVERANAETNR